ncbi:unnamed protein product, partial [Ixodes pacificus]
MDHHLPSNRGPARPEETHTRSRVLRHVARTNRAKKKKGNPSERNQNRGVQHSRPQSDLAKTLPNRGESTECCCSRRVPRRFVIAPKWTRDKMPLTTRRVCGGDTSRSDCE